MRRLVVILLILVSAFILYMWTVKTGPEPPPAGVQLAVAMAVAEAVNGEILLEARTQLPSSIQGEQAQREELEALAGSLLGDKECELTWSSHAQGYLLEGQGQGFRIQLSLTTQASEQTNYLFAELILRDPALLSQMEIYWQRVFEARGYQVRYSTLATGTLPGYLAYNEQELILASIFQTLAVREPWKMRDGNLVSWGGRSPKIPGYLRDAGGEPINIQAALRYHQLENSTYLHLGSPLIYVDY